MILLSRPTSSSPHHHLPQSSYLLPSPWKTSTYLFLTPFLAADAGRFDGGRERRSSSDDPGGLGGPEGGRGGPLPEADMGATSEAVTLSAREDFWRLIPPSGISVNPGGVAAVDDRVAGGIPGTGGEPVLRDKSDGGGVAELAREAGAADWGREGGGGGGAVAAGSGFA